MFLILSNITINVNSVVLYKEEVSSPGRPIPPGTITLRMITGETVVLSKADAEKFQNYIRNHYIQR